MGYQGGGGGGFGARPREMFKAVCADCKKECEVPFKPREDRPVYCKECFSAHKDSGRQVRQNFSFEKRKREEAKKKKREEKRIKRLNDKNANASPEPAPQIFPEQAQFSSLKKQNLNTLGVLF